MHTDHKRHGIVSQKIFLLFIKKNVQYSATWSLFQTHVWFWTKYVHTLWLKSEYEIETGVNGQRYNATLSLVIYWLCGLRGIRRYLFPCRDRTLHSCIKLLWLVSFSASLVIHFHLLRYKHNLYNYSQFI